MDKKTSWKGLTFLGITFFLMCALKLWFTIFVLFTAALLITLLSGKAKYCLSYCPIGTIQNSMYEKRNFTIPAMLFTRGFRIFTITLFWILMAGILVFSRGNLPVLWLYFLQLMLSMLFFAIVTQTLFGKRYFCKNLCPLRIPVLAPVMKTRNRVIRFFK